MHDTLYLISKSVFTMANLLYWPSAKIVWKKTLFKSVWVYVTVVRKKRDSEGGEF